MDTILYLAESRVSSCAQQKHLGVCKQLAREGYSLRKIATDGLKPSELKKLVSFWGACGVIIDCGGKRPQVSERHLPAIPVVYLDIAREFESPRKRSVSYDIRATCHLAARELLSLDCAAYGYAGYGKGIPWSEERKRVFVQAMKLNGHAVETFDLDPETATPSAFYRKLTAWIQKVPKPFGLFAANDDYALHFQAVVQKLKLRIPSDIAILGVDDESDNLSFPGISSIQLDFRKAGSLAAELLLEGISNPSSPCGNRHFGPVQLLRRRSTREINRPNANMSAILQRIREQVPRGLTAAEVVSWMPGSRRLAETRFRASTGHSILEEITVRRIERAKELLSKLDYPIGEIAELCGYHTFNAFRNAFKAQTGLTPRDWRKRG